MELGAEVRVTPELPAEVLGNDPGLQASQPDADLGHRLAQGRQQGCQRGLARQVYAPAGDLDACHHDFPVALSGQLLCLLQSGFQWGGADGTPGIGDDAVGAEVDAAVLDLQHGPGPLLQPAGRQDLKFPAAQGIVQGVLVGLALQGLQQVGQELLPPAGASQYINAQCLDSLRGVLGVAAADADDGLRVLPAAPADHGPVFLVGNGGDRAGIDHVGIALLVETADLVAHRAQQVLHGLGLILVCFASEGIKSNSHLVKIANFTGAPLLLLAKPTIAFLQKYRYNTCILFVWPLGNHIIHESRSFVQPQEVFMHDFVIRLHSVRDVNDFVTLSAPLCRVSLSDGFRTVDGKSFMEIFCLRLSGPITVHAECTEEEFHRFFQESQRFLLP